MQAAKMNLVLTVWIAFVCASACAPAAKPSQKENWWLHADYQNLRPSTVAVLPMQNLTLDPKMEDFLIEEAYRQLSQKGYRRIALHHTHQVMQQLGIQVAGQLSGISNEQLRSQLQCDAVLQGRVDQSSTIHSGVYDAVVVSISLVLRDLKTGTVLWQTEQWRNAHRQWQLDPLNMLINYAVHENVSKKNGIQWLVKEMLTTLPAGPVLIDQQKLLKNAREISSDAQ